MSARSVDGTDTVATPDPDAPLIDARGPRFGAAITSVLLLLVILLGLTQPPSSTVVDRLLEPGSLLLTALVLLFAWGAFAGVQRHPYASAVPAPGGSGVWGRRRSVKKCSPDFRALVGLARDRGRALPCTWLGCGRPRDRRGPPRSSRPSSTRPSPTLPRVPVYVLIAARGTVRTPPSRLGLGGPPTVEENDHGC